MVLSKVSSRPARKPLVIITHPLHGGAVKEELEPHARVRLIRDRKKLLEALPAAEGLVSLLTVKVDRELLSRAPKLKVVGNVAVGVDNIDLAACAERGIAVCNTPKVLVRATAELGLCLLLAAARRLPEGERMARGGRFKGWDPDMLHGLLLQGRHAVVVGAGRIGRETERLYRAVGLTTEFIIKSDSDREILAKLRRAQVVSIHLPLSARTRHWLDEERIRALPRDAIVVNTARGPVIDENALIRALEAGRIFAAGLDVYEHEPYIPSALRRLPNTVLLPHLGSSTRETREAMSRLAIRGVVDVLAGRRPWNRVKIPHGQGKAGRQAHGKSRR